MGVSNVPNQKSDRFTLVELTHWRPTHAQPLYTVCHEIHAFGTSFTPLLIVDSKRLLFGYRIVHLSSTFQLKLNG
ncbi:hypothetical protein [Shimazuella kribbensis]|uniref:hypothetical protein n=1 Tax=Shimazuella kribbensis TaxID=139808 RepID=UPI0012EC2062|nr:hypothetical protein [Shimazuella kribbensis]